MGFLRTKGLDEVEVEEVEEITPFELIVKFRSSEAATFTPIKAGTRTVTNEFLSEDSIMSETMQTPGLEYQKARIASYPCFSYSIAEGALFVGASIENRNGFFIPLDAIQEVQIVDNRTAEQIAHYESTT